MSHPSVALPAGAAARGNAQLLAEPLVALFCSVRCPGDVILRIYDLAVAMREANVPVISGFHTPMEKECLRLLLRGTQPVVICPARSIANMRLPATWRPALAEGRLLVISTFPPAAKRATAKFAAERNDFVVRLASRVLIAHAAPGGKSEALARRAVELGKDLLTLDSSTNENLIALGAKPICPEDFAPRPIA